MNEPVSTPNKPKQLPPGFERKSKLERSPPKLTPENTKLPNLPLTASTENLVLRSGKIVLTPTDQSKTGGTTGSTNSNSKSKLNTLNQLDLIIAKEVPKPLLVKIEPELLSENEEDILELGNNKIIPVTTPTENDNIEEILTRIDQTRITVTNTMAKQTKAAVYSQVMSMIPVFRGADSPNTHSELLDFIRIAEWTRNNLIEEENYNTFDEIIQFRLVDDARRKTQNKTITDFDSLKNILHQMYSTTESLIELRRNFDTCQQQNGESISDFGRRLSNTFEEYISGFEAKYGEKPNASTLKDYTEQAMIIFTKGLKDLSLRRQMVVTRKDNLEEVIREAVIVEKLLKDIDSTDHTTPSIKPEQLHQPQLNQQQQYFQPPSIQQPQFNQIIPQKQQNFSNKGNCHYCGKPNHVMKDCHFYLNSPQQPSMSAKAPTTQINYQKIPTQNKVSRYNENKYCIFCRINGHEVNDCRKKNTQEKQFTGFRSGPSNNYANPNYQQHTNQNYQQRPEPNAWTLRQNSHQHQENQQQKFQNSPGRSRMKCNFCGKTNHTMENCFSRARATNQTPQTNQQPVLELGDELSKMRICNINLNNETEEYYPENSNGSVEKM